MNLLALFNNQWVWLGSMIIGGVFIDEPKRRREAEKRAAADAERARMKHRLDVIAPLKAKAMPPTNPQRPSEVARRAQEKHTSDQ